MGRAPGGVPACASPPFHYSGTCRRRHGTGPASPATIASRCAPWPTLFPDTLRTTLRCCGSGTCRGNHCILRSPHLSRSPIARERQAKPSQKAELECIAAAFPKRREHRPRLSEAQLHSGAPGWALQYCAIGPAEPTAQKTVASRNNRATIERRFIRPPGLRVIAETVRLYFQGQIVPSTRIQFGIAWVMVHNAVLNFRQIWKYFSSSSLRSRFQRLRVALPSGDSYHFAASQ